MTTRPAIEDADCACTDATGVEAALTSFLQSLTTRPRLLRDPRGANAGPARRATVGGA
jgi:hypothetical protein